jgi:hypothetical protein
MRKSAGKGEIRKELRAISREAGESLPNMNRVHNLINARGRIHASRRPVREVLKEDEFIPLRPKPGRKPKRLPKTAPRASSHGKRTHKKTP